MSIVSGHPSARRLLCLILAVVVFISFDRLNDSVAAEGFQDLIVPVDDPAPEVQKAKQQFLAKLAGIDPARRGGGVIVEDGYYVLFGQLFGGLPEYALIARGGHPEAEGSDGLLKSAVAVWSKAGWKIQAIWKVAPLWRIEDPDPDKDYFPIRPSRAPFWTKELSGDTVPEVVIVGDINRYWQEHYLLKLDSAGRLQFVAAAMGRPGFTHGLVRLSFNSGSRSIWGREEFFRWKGEDLIPRASWHDETPYNNEDPPFTAITRYDKAGLIEGVWRVQMADGSSDFVNQYEVYDGTIDKKNEEAAENGGPTQQRKRLGVVSFVWPRSVNQHPEQRTMERESRYIWERLSGLPANALPKEDDMPALQPLPESVAVRVSGDAELSKLLTRKARK